MPDQDAYLRIDASERAPEHYGDGADGLIFVDLDVVQGDKAARLADQLRRAPRGFFRSAEAVILRWPSVFGDPASPGLTLAAEQVTVLSGKDEPIPVAAVSFRLADEPWVQWVGDAPNELSNAHLLARARAVEFEALLAAGRAIWSPSGYHYQLPSGDHTETFVRVADAIRVSRDATVLASWLLSYVGPGLSVMLDSRTLVPIALALDAELRARGANLGPIVALNEYPETNHEYRALAGRTGGAGALALLTVTSSGRTAAGLAGALEQTSQGWRLETLFSRVGGQAHELAPRDSQGIGLPWLGLNLPSQPRAGCGLCRGSRKRPYVQIDPHNFMPLVLPSPPLVTMPHLRSEHEPLLEWYDRVDGIGLECAPPRRTELRRGKDPSAIRFYPHRLLLEEGFRAAAIERLKEHLRESAGKVEDGWCDRSAFHGVDAFAVLDEDMEADGFEGLLQSCAASLDIASPQVVVFPTNPGTGEARDEEQRNALCTARRICVVTVGAVTGGTLQELLWRVHSAKRGLAKDDYKVTGLAVHARPSTFREWQTLSNAYSRRLMALWVTYLPWRSVLDEEARLLEQVSGPTGEAPYLETRRAFCKPLTSDWQTRLNHFGRYGGTNPRALFWGLDPAKHETPYLLATSYFGHQVGPLAAFVGFGAAMQRARLDSMSKGAPPWLHFEMAGISSSYFDTILIVSALRWLEPYEADWGAEGRGFETILREVWERVQRSEADERIILSELLLAAAQSKLPRSSGSWLRAKVEEVRGRWAGDFASIDLGAELLGLAHGSSNV